MRRRHFSTRDRAPGSSGSVNRPPERDAGGREASGETRLAYSTSGEKESPSRPAPEAACGRTGVRIRLERRASSRLVTVVTGLPPGKGLADLIRVLKAACGAGGTLKEGALELQGDHREKVASALTDRRIPWKRAGG